MNHGGPNVPERQVPVRPGSSERQVPDDCLWTSRKAEPSDRAGHEQALQRAQHALTLTNHPHKLDRAAVKCLEEFCRGQADFDDLIRVRQDLGIRAGAAGCVGLRHGFAGAAVAIVCFAACHPCSETAERLSATYLEQAIELRLTELASKGPKPPRAARASKRWIFLKDHLREEPGYYDEWTDYLRRTEKDCYDYGKASREHPKIAVWQTGNAREIAESLDEASYDSRDLNEAVTRAPWLHVVQDELRRIQEERGIDPEDILYGGPPKNLLEALERYYPEGKQSK